MTCDNEVENYIRFDDNNVYYKPTLDEMSLAYATVIVTIESGCDPLKGEYSLYLTSFSKHINLFGNELDLIRECIEENIEQIIQKINKDDCNIEVVLKEIGEWDDVFWNGYYVIERIVELK